MLAFFVVVLAFSAVVQSTNIAYNETTVLLNERNNSTYDGAVDNEEIAMITTKDLARRVFGGNLLGKLKQKVMGKPSRPVVSVPLHLNRNHLWVAQIALGNPPHTFDVVVDTGSSLFWVEYRADSHAVPVSWPGGPYMSRYSGRPSFSGVVNDDTIDLCGIKGVGRVIAAMQVTSRTTYDADGELGLALSLHDPQKLAMASPFVTGFLTKKYSSPIFALYLAPYDGMMHIGGAHKSYYTGKIEYHRVIRTNPLHQVQLWRIGNASINVNGVNGVVRNAETVLDTGIWDIFGPPDDVEKVYKELRGTNHVHGRYDLFPCQQLRDVVISWKKGKKWKIAHFSKGSIDGSICEGALKTHSDSRNVWILGLSFLVNVYAVYDANPKLFRVGFGDLMQVPAYQLNAGGGA